MAAAVWASRPDPRPWCAGLRDQAARWRPDPALEIDARAIAGAIQRACTAAEPWLAHPCMNRLTFPAAEHQAERDVRMVTWVAANAGTSVGGLTLERRSWRWSPKGHAVEIAPGRHDLARLVADDGLGDQGSIALDPRGRSVGFPLPGGWSGSLPLLDVVVREGAQALALLARRLPACAGLAAAVTRVVVPLRSGDGTWSSGSEPGLPGLVQVAGLNGPVATLEGLVHESAHHHFTMLEAAGALVDPAHADLYPSPLRSEPRPLGRVLLAVHALRHVAAFYDDALEADLLGPEWADRRRHLAGWLEQGLASVSRGRAHLTSRGRSVLDGLV